MNRHVHKRIEGRTLVGCFAGKWHTVDRVNQGLFQFRFNFFRRAFVLSGFIVYVEEALHLFIRPQISFELIQK